MYFLLKWYCKYVDITSVFLWEEKLKKKHMVKGSIEILYLPNSQLSLIVQVRKPNALFKELIL